MTKHLICEVNDASKKQAEIQYFALHFIILLNMITK